MKLMCLLQIISYNYLYSGKAMHYTIYCTTPYCKKLDSKLLSNYYNNFMLIIN